MWTRNRPTSSARAKNNEKLNFNDHQSLFNTVFGSPSVDSDKSCPRSIFKVQTLKGDKDHDGLLKNVSRSLAQALPAKNVPSFATPMVSDISRNAETAT